MASWQVPDHSWVSFLTTGRLLERPKGHSLRRTRWFLAIFGSPWRPKNRPKIDPWLKKRPQGSFFNAFLSRVWFYSLWGWIFHRFFMKFRCNFWCIFSRLRMIFSTWRTLKFIDRRDGLSTFYFFHFLKFMKTLTKKQSKIGIPKKHRKIGPGGSQNGPKMAQN